MTPNNSIIYYEDFKYNESQELRDFLNSKKIKALLENIEKRVVLVLGGDGTMISAIHKYQHENIPFLGINFGHKGFLLGDRNTTEETEFIEQDYPLLEAKISRDSEEEKVFYAINEIDIDASRGKIVELDIQVQGKTSISLAGDGLIISTPAGSTAYNKSLGGPIIPNEVKAFILNPKAPFKPIGQSPIVISQEEIIEIKNTGRQNAFNLYADGQELLYNSQEKIRLQIQKSKKQITMLIAKNYEHIWNTKSLTEQGFNRGENTF